MPKNFSEESDITDLKEYYTYFVVIDMHGKIDSFYPCEKKYLQTTVEEFELLRALLPEPHNLLNNPDIAYYKTLSLRARYCLGEFMILKTPVPITPEQAEKFLENRDLATHRL
jgi:hypothetical protein